MNATLSAWGRCLAIGGLWLLIGLLIVLSWATGKANGLALSGAEAAKRKLNDLRGAV